MKRLFALIVVFFALKEAQAQHASFIYCRMTVAETRHNGSNEIINIDLGTKENMKDVDSTFLRQSEEAKRFTNTINALDYLSSLGWEYVNTVSPVRGYVHSYNYVFILRKSLHRD